MQRGIDKGIQNLVRMMLLKARANGDGSKCSREGNVFGCAGEGELGLSLPGMDWHVIYSNVYDRDVGYDRNPGGPRTIPAQHKIRCIYPKTFSIATQT